MRNVTHACVCVCVCADLTHALTGTAKPPRGLRKIKEEIFSRHVRVDISSREVGWAKKKEGNNKTRKAGSPSHEIRLAFYLAN